MNRAANQYGKALFEAARAEQGDRELKHELDKVQAAARQGDDTAAMELISTELLGSFDDVYGGFAEKFNEYYGAVDVELVSAFPVPDGDRPGLLTQLERVTGKTVNLTVRVDKSLIGGMVIKFDGTEIDGSLRARLRSIQQRMGGVTR